MKTRRFLALLLTFALFVSICACDSSSFKCKNCGGEYQLGVTYCPSCGEKVALSGATCSKGHENDFGANFCAECGEPLDAQDNDNGNNDGGNNNDNGNNDNAGNNGGSQEQLEKKNWLLQEQRYDSTGRTFKYFYDADGYLVGKEVWDDNTGLFSYNTYANDGHGNCIEEFSSLGTFLGGDGITTYTNTYDTQGRLTKALSDSGSYDQYYYEGDELVKVLHVDSDGEETYDLYENGRMTLSYRCDGTTNYKETTIEFNYDDSGRCTGTNNESFEVDEYGNILADPGGSTYKYITLEDYRSQNLHSNKYANGQGGSSNGSSGNGSSGGSSGGSSSNGTKCLYCNQTGKINCYACDGTGKVYGQTTCKVPSCYNGKIKCPHCGGDGVFGN